MYEEYKLEKKKWGETDVLSRKDYLKRNNWAPVFQTIDSKKANKPCTVETGCEYFEEFVRVA